MKAVLVICEGRHDIIFVQRSLGAIAGCDWFKGTIRELPSPFGQVRRRSEKGLVARRIEREVDDLTLRSAASSTLPQFVSAVEDKTAQTIFVLIRANGKEQVDAVIDMLQDLDASLEAGPMEISHYATAFLFDADDEGLAATLTTFRKGYCDHFGDLSAADHAVWVEAPTCHVGAFVIHKSPSDQTGTLEDHLAPLALAAWPSHFKAASAFINDGRQAGEAVSKGEANRLKGVITSTGQFQHPGAPLSAIIDREGIPREHFKTCGLSNDLVRFLRAVPWQVPSDEPASPTQS